MESEPSGVGVRLLGQFDLGVERVVQPPGGRQALEDGAVAEPALLEPVVQFGRVQLGRAGGRPGGETVAGLGGAGREEAVGVPGPRLVGPGLGARVDLYGAPRPVVGFAHDDLEGDAAALGQHERGLEGELLQESAADVVAGLERELHEARAGEQHAAVHGVVGHPRLGVQGDPCGEGDRVGVG